MTKLIAFLTHPVVAFAMGYLIGYSLGIAA